MKKRKKNTERNYKNAKKNTEGNVTLPLSPPRLKTGGVR